MQNVLPQGQNINSGSGLSMNCNCWELNSPSLEMKLFDVVCLQVAKQDLCHHSLIFSFYVGLGCSSVRRPRPLTVCESSELLPPE